jgi:hypothetical protein
MRLPHLVGHHVAIEVHRRSDVAVPHQLLLNSDWRPNGIQPTAVYLALRRSLGFKLKEHERCLRKLLSFLKETVKAQIYCGRCIVVAQISGEEHHYVCASTFEQR